MKAPLRVRMLVGALLAVGLIGSSARAAVLTVTANLVIVNADGKCSLREAIENAVADSSVNTDCIPNGAYGADTIELTNSTYTVADGAYAGDGSNGLPPIVDTLTIHGNGSTIQRDSGATTDFRLFDITSTGNLTLDDLTLRNGKASDPGFGTFGGAIFNNGGQLTLDSSTIADSQSVLGGAIGNFGHIELNCSTISGNSANFGGGIFEATSATATLTGSAVVNNHAIDDGDSVDDGSGAGGGIYNGGVQNIGSLGTQGLVIVNSTIAGNRADTNGGGIFNDQANVFLFNASIISNTADDDNNGSGDGGGIGERGASFNPGNGVILEPAQTRFVDTIIANNTDRGGEAPDCNDQQTSPLTPMLNSAGYNLIEDLTGCTVTPVANSGTDVTGVDPHLGSLATPGTVCNTAIACPIPLSDAIDAGDPNGCLDPNDTALTTDQRGKPRPLDGGSGTVRCDIGACEFGVAAVGTNPAPLLRSTGLGLLVLALIFVGIRARRDN